MSLPLGLLCELEIEKRLHYFGGDDWPLGRAKPVTIPSSVKFACVRIFLRGVGSLRERLFRGTPLQRRDSPPKPLHSHGGC